MASVCRQGMHVSRNSVQCNARRPVRPLDRALQAWRCWPPSCPASALTPAARGTGGSRVSAAAAPGPARCCCHCLTGCGCIKTRQEVGKGWEVIRLTSGFQRRQQARPAIRVAAVLPAGCPRPTEQPGRQPRPSLYHRRLLQHKALGAVAAHARRQAAAARRHLWSGDHIHHVIRGVGQRRAGEACGERELGTGRAAWSRCF